MIAILFTILIIWIYFRYFGPLIITYKLHSVGAVKPTKAYGRPACYDLYASNDVLSVPDGQWREIPIDISFAAWPHFYIPFFKLTITPFGNVASRIHSRSGLALKSGIRNHLGIIDNDYREKLSVLMFNHGTHPIRIKKGMKIGQIEFYRVPPVIFWQKKKLSKSMRGSNGFGSSGK